MWGRWGKARSRFSVIDRLLVEIRNDMRPRLSNMPQSASAMTASAPATGRWRITKPQRFNPLRSRLKSNTHGPSTRLEETGIL